MDPGIPIATTTSVAVMMLLLGAFFKNTVSANRRERDLIAQNAATRVEYTRVLDIMDYRLETQELETRHCQHNFLQLAGQCAKGGMDIDRDLWSTAPLPTRRDPRLGPVQEAVA